LLVAGVATADAAHDSILFAQDATSGSLIPVKGQKGNYVLTLNGVSNSVLFFDNRPGRDTGTISMKRMLEGFFNKKHEAPPNAAVSVSARGSKRQHVMALEFRTAKYDAKRHRVRYRAHALEQVSSGLAEHVNPRAGVVLPRRFGATAVFIDTLINGCGGYLVNATGVTWTLTSSNLLSTDTWETSPSNLSVSMLNHWGTDSGFARGCANEATWTAPDGSTVTIVLADPYTGPNTYLCSLSFGAPYTCTLDSSFGSTTGDSLVVEFDLVGAQ